MAESTEDVLPSETGRQIYETKVKASLDVGDHRSVFLIGEAGVGKTQMMRYIADLHGGLRLRFKLADLAGLTGTDKSRMVVPTLLKSPRMLLRLLRLVARRRARRASAST